MKKNLKIAALFLALTLSAVTLSECIERELENSGKNNNYDTAQYESMSDNYGDEFMNNNSQNLETIIKYVGCEYEKIDDSYSGQQITELYLKEYENGRKNGYTPVILNCDSRLAEILVLNSEYNVNTEEYRKKLLSMNIDYGKEFLKNRFEEHIEDIKNYPDSTIDIYGHYDITQKPSKYFDTTVLFSLCLDNLSYLSKEDLLKIASNPEEYFNNLYNNPTSSNLILAKIPTLNPWEVFAWIQCGNWNECPCPEDMMAVCKYWYQEHKAVPAIISGTTLFYYCFEPVKNKSDSLKLAEEQFGFCSDIVLQGFGRIKSLASYLEDSTVWTFWWD